MTRKIHLGVLIVLLTGAACAIGFGSMLAAFPVAEPNLLIRELEILLSFVSGVSLAFFAGVYACMKSRS